MTITEVPITTTATSSADAAAQRAALATPSSAAQLFQLYLTEMRLFFREPQVLIFVLGFPVLMVLVLGGVFGTDNDDSGFEYVSPSDYYVAAYFGVVLAAVGLMMLPAHIASYRERGVLRRFDGAGFARWVFPTVQYLCGLTFAAMGFVSLLLTASITYGVPTMAEPGWALLGLAVGTLACISIGVALGMLYPSARAAQGTGLMLFFPMFLLAGGGPPLAALTDGMRAVANWLPLTHVIRATQEPWLGIGESNDHLLITVGLLAASTAVWLWRAKQVSTAA